MNIVYFEKWFLAKSQGINDLSVDVAKARHETGLPYVALVQQRAVIDSSGQWISAIFLDDDQSEFLRYDFQKLEPDRLFLKSAMYRERDGCPGTNVAYLFNFQTDGKYVAARIAGAEIVEVEGKAQAGLLWEDVPPFGRYERLLIIERGLPKGSPN